MNSLPFKTEIRNSPKEQTIKIYLSDISLNDDVKGCISSFDEIETIEIRETIGRNRVEKNITIFRKEGVDINVLKEGIEDCLANYFKK